MREVFIKYNPYRLITEITVDGKAVKKDSRLNVADKRLQEWVDDLPEILRSEYGSNQFKITFHGTVVDYEDIVAAAQEAAKCGINIETVHIPGKEMKEKEQALVEIFREIQNGPIETLKDSKIERAFKNAQNDNFEVSVFATMSAGKSTVINALLGKKLMPAKNEACTATITSIKDVDSDHFEAQAVDSAGNELRTYRNLTYKDMSELNAEPQVSEIYVEGDIPFVTADDMSLILVDTPGPNNARTEEHKKTTYHMLKESSKTLVMYVMNATQQSTTDDAKFLKDISESMKVGGKQSRDRFIFVLNKVDSFTQGEDNVEESIIKIKEYLKEYGIENPNVYPASALSALEIRTILANKDNADEEKIYDANGRVRKLNRHEEMHLEKYAPLPTSSKNIILDRLTKAINSENQDEQALIHSGIVSLEEAIKLYVTKYARPAKIKNIFDTFSKNLESAKSVKELETTIASSDEDRKRITQQITDIKEEIGNGEKTKEFRKQIDKIDYSKEITERCRQIRLGAQETITNCFDDVRDGDLSHAEADKKCREFMKTAEDVRIRVELALEDLVQNTVQKNAEDLLAQYKQRLSTLLGKEVNIGELNVLELMKGDLPSTSDIISGATVTREEVVGRQWVKNTNKKWYKFWTWFDDDGYYKDVYGSKEYINGSKLKSMFIEPIETQLIKNIDLAKTHATRETKKIKDNLTKQFDELDKVLVMKLDDLAGFEKNKEEIEKRGKEAKEHLDWLNAISKRVDDILDV